MQGFFNQSLAQEEGGQSSSSSDSKISWGLKFGLNRASFTDHNGTTFSGPDQGKRSSQKPWDQGYSSTYGYSAGVYVAYQVNEHFSISGKAAYTVLDFDQINESILFDTDGPMFSASHLDYTQTHLNLQNIEGVVKFNVYPFSFESVKPKLYAGYSASFMINADANTERTSTGDAAMQPQTTSVHHDVTDRFAYFNHAVVLGIGVDFDAEIMFIKGLSIDLDYKYGVNNINNVTNYQAFSTNTLELVLGLKF